MPFDAFECFPFLPMATFRFVRETLRETRKRDFYEPALEPHMTKKEADQLSTSTPRNRSITEITLNRINGAM